MKPLTLSAHEVRAVLDGTKTQHWAPIKPKPWNSKGDTVDISIAPTAQFCRGSDGRDYYAFDHPRGGPLTAYVASHSPGDQIWVREACYIAPVGWTDSPVNPKGEWRQEVAYAADDRSGYTKEAARDYGLKLRGAVTMPRWASLITLDVTGVRVCRVQDVTEADAIAMGVPDFTKLPTSDDMQEASTRLRWPQRSFELNWIARHGPASWDANDWCAVIDFERRG